MDNSMPHPSPIVDDRPTQQFVSVKDVAATYGVHVATIYRLIKDGKLTAHKVGPRATRLDAAEVYAAFRG